MDVFESDDKVLVKADNGNEYVFSKTGNTYEWDNDETTVSHFPSDVVIEAVESVIDGDVAPIFPLTITVHAHDDPNTREFCVQAGLPYDEANLTELLYYMLNRRNTTAFRPWIRAVTLGNFPPSKRLNRVSYGDV